MSDYLWDRTGRDDEVEALERILKPSALGEPGPLPVRRPTRAWPGRLVGLAAAVLVVTGLYFALMTTRPGVLVNAEGLSRPLKCASGDAVPHTDLKRVIDLGGIGFVEAEPGARLRVVSVSNDLHKLRLDFGVIHARISADARPGLFQVETPAATCVDLGCVYRLDVDEGGIAQVRVTLGRVAFRDGAREVFIPQEAICRAVPGRGAGTPVYERVSDAFKAAARAFDEAPSTERTVKARELAKLSRTRDHALTLWHLLQDSDVRVVGIGYDALTQLSNHPECGVGPLSHVSKESVLRRDPAALKAWKRHLFPEWDW